MNSESSVESDPYLQVLREAIEKVQLLRYQGWHNSFDDLEHEDPTMATRPVSHCSSTRDPEEGCYESDGRSVASTAVVDTLGAPMPWPRLSRNRYRMTRLKDGVEDSEGSTSTAQMSQSHRGGSVVYPFEADMLSTDDTRNIKGILRSFDEVVRRLNLYSRYKQLRAESAREKGTVASYGQSASILAHTQTSKIRTLFESSSAPSVLVATLRGFDAGHARRGQNLFATFKGNSQTFNTPFLKSYGDTRIGFIHTKFTLPKELKLRDPTFPNTAEGILRYLIANNTHMQSLIMDCFWIFYLEFIALSSLPTRYLRYRQFLSEEHDAMQRSAIVRQELGIPTDGGRAHRHQRELVTDNVRKQLHQYGSDLETHNFLSEQRLNNYTALVQAYRKDDDLDEDTEGGNSMAKASVGRLVAKDIVAKASRRPRKDETNTLKGANLCDGYVNEASILRTVAGIDMSLSRARRMLPFHLLTHSQLVNVTLPQATDIVPISVAKTHARPVTALNAHLPLRQARGVGSALPSKGALLPMSPRRPLQSASTARLPPRATSASVTQRTHQRTAPIDSPFPSPEDYHTPAFLENIRKREERSLAAVGGDHHGRGVPTPPIAGLLTTRPQTGKLTSSESFAGTLSKPNVKPQMVTVQNVPTREPLSGQWQPPSPTRPTSSLGGTHNLALANLSFGSDSGSAALKPTPTHSYAGKAVAQDDGETQVAFIIQTNYSSEVDPAECLLLLADFNGERAELMAKLQARDADEEEQAQLQLALQATPAQSPLLSIATPHIKALGSHAGGTPSSSHLSQRLAASILAAVSGPRIEHLPLHEMEARAIAKTGVFVQKHIELTEALGGARAEIPFITAAAIETVRTEQDKLFSRMSHHLHRLFAFNRFFADDDDADGHSVEGRNSSTKPRKRTGSAKSKLPNGSDNPILDELSPAMREIKASILGPLPDVLAQMVWLELKHWLPYAEDLLGNTQRADLKRMLSNWIHGVDNTQTSHWSISEQDVDDERTKLAKVKAVRKESKHSNGSISFAPIVGEQSSASRIPFFQNSDSSNKAYALSPEALVAMSKHKMSDPQCATAYETTVRELNAMRLGGFEENSVREERQPRRPSTAARQSRQMDSKDILRVHRFSPANRAPRRWHERGKKASSDLGAITQASPILTNTAPGYFDLSQNSPSMRRFLTDGNTDLSKTKRSNVLTWSQ